MVMMLPGVLAAIMARAASWQAYRTPLKLTARTRSRSSSRVRDVEGVWVRGAARLGDQGGGLVEAGLVAVRAVDGGAGFGEEQCAFSAYAARGAGD